MKVLRLLAAVLCAGMLCASCDDDENKVKTATVTFEGEYWNALIDTPQYGGPLLYGSTASNYKWFDDITYLSGGMTNAWGGMYGFSEGGIAISNYVSQDYENHKNFNHQLEAPSVIGGKNFAVVYCNANLYVTDAKAHVIQSMQVCPTTYLIGIAKYGDDYTKALTGPEDFLTLHITADNGASIQVKLVEGGKVQETWKKVDLSQLGAVKSLSFSMTGSDSGEYGLNTPAYVAIDNIVVEM